MKHSAPATFDTECSVHDMSYVRYCSLTMKKSVSKTEKKKNPLFHRAFVLLEIWHGMCQVSDRANSR